MANANSSGEGFDYATVDTAPGADGFWTGSISIRDKKLQEMYFSIRGTGVAVVILQFKCTGDAAWTDYNNDATAFVVGDRKLIDGSSGNVTWRAGVKQGGLTSGAVTFGFDWYRP